MVVVPGYEVLSEIYESANTLVCRAVRQNDGRNVALKILKEDYPAPEELTRYRQEYEMTNGHSLNGMIRSYALKKFKNRPVIVLEDFGGESLDIWMKSGTTFSLAKKLSIFVKIAEALGNIHSADIIHKDINPSNIVYNPGTGELKIIDFGISTILSRETPEIKAINVMEGTLAYISPEQTGRMNRPVDYRTDFYSLGATFHTLLVSKKPFETKDPMELIHCHIARQPKPPCEIDPQIPEAVSEIVMKLMSKTSEERYQSAWGLRTDLEKCLEQYKQVGSIGDFSPGQNDIPDKFRLPGKLYGRESEIGELVSAFDRASRGRCELVLVSGYPGIGKSVLVNEIRRPVADRHGYFISGKFDQYSRNIPYSAAADAFRKLVRQILGESEAKLAYWRKKLSEALGPNGRVIIDIIPEVALIIGPQPPVESVDPSESENRFHMVFRNFVRAFAGPEHTVAIFLDDLQWADSATLKLAEMLLADDESEHLLLMGAYRHNEVGPDHPLSMALDRLEKFGAETTRIMLPPLNQTHVAELISDVLRRDIESVTPPARLVLRKTEGNPFFLNQFLTTLYQEGFIFFIPPGPGAKSGKWDWDIDLIEAVDITDNVVDLMIRKLNRLPESSANAVRLAACVGNRFDLETLSMICHESAETSPDLIAETFRELFPALTEGLILPASNMEISNKNEVRSQLVFSEYRFLHDRVQQAAYSSIDNSRKPAIHRMIGKNMLKTVSDKERGERLFELADHLNRSRELVSDAAEEIELARLNLEASRKAKQSIAYSAALNYLEVATNLLGENIWQQDEDLALALFMERAEVEYLNGNYGKSETLIETIWKNARSPLIKAEAYALLVTQYTMLGKNEAAISTAAKALALFGAAFPDRTLGDALNTELAQVKKRLGSRPVSSLANLPEMRNEEKKVLMKVLMTVHTPVYFANRPRLYAWILARMANLSMQYGQVPESAKGYASLGNSLSGYLGEYQTGYEFGILGVRLSEKFNHRACKCKTCLIVAMFLNHWVRHAREADIHCDEGYRAGMESGEFQFVGYIMAYGKTINAFHGGRHLGELLSDLNSFLVFTRKVKHHLSTDNIRAAHIIISGLRDLPEGRPPDSGLAETEFLETARRNRSFPAICFFLTIKAQSLYFSGKSEAALEYILDAEKLLGYIRGTFTTADHNFFHTLIMADMYPEMSPEIRIKFMSRMTANQVQMKTWADNCPENFLHRYLLAEAEIARITGEFETAINLYDQAGESAGDNGYVQNEALAYELASKFWVERGNVEVSALYMKMARYGYRLWGAKRKAREIEESWPDLAGERRPDTDETLTRTDSVSAGLSKSFDIAAFIKTSQAISGEIVLEDLIKTLMKVVMENAGAERGLLILKKEGGFMVEARAVANGKPVMKASPVPLDEIRDLSKKIVQYVIRTGDDVVLNDASAQGIFSSDEYIRENRIRSILCMPIRRRGNLTGVLYLENNKTTGAFTSDRVKVLGMIASQAAISIDNANLYQKYYSLYENAIEGIFQCTPAGRFISVNPSMAKIMGYDSPDELTRSVAGICREMYVDPAECDTFSRLLPDQGSVAGFETRVYRKDKRVIWVSISARSVRNARGDIISYEGSAVDITERKEREKAEKNAAAADAANRAKSEFLATMSHEIRTPLNAIIGLANLSLGTALTQRQRTYLEKIDTSANVLLRVINDILDFSKIEAGKLDLEHVEFTLRDVMDNVSDIFSGQAAGKGLDFVLWISKEIPGVLVGDPLRLVQVLVNLIGNAMKFTHEGEIILKAEPEEVANTRARILFTVKDTGIGIPSEKIKGLFSPFAQADGSLARRYGGSGLGLSICKRLVEMMKGRIHVESEPGMGSRFRFTAEFGRPIKTKIRAVMPERYHDRRVLLADSHELSRKHMERILAEFFLDATLAESEAEAVELLISETDNPYHLVIVHWNTGIDGIDLASEIRENPKIPDVPVIVITKFKRESDMRRAEEAGVNSFLIKPVNHALLGDTIRGIFSAEDEPLSEKESESPEHVRKMKGARILLVEDNEINQEVAAEILGTAGFLVDIACNGKEAIESLFGENEGKSAYQAILMDIQMPEMDGVEATKKIRELERGRTRTPIIAMTAHAMKGDRKKCFEAGMDDYVTKPVDQDHLFSILSRWIDADIPECKNRGAETEIGEYPKQLPGINVEAGLRRLGGNIGLLRRLINEFSSDYADYAEMVNGALKNGNNERALQLTHTIKGIAANLSADELHESALGLERGIKTGNTSRIQTQLAAFAGAMIQLLASSKRLERFFQKTGESTEEKGAGRRNERAAVKSEVRNMLVSLADLLKNNNPTAEIFLDSMKSKIDSPETKDHLALLESLIMKFDFKSARNTLDELSEALGIEITGKSESV